MEENIRGKILEIIEEKKITQKELADKLDISVSSLRRYLSGERDMPLSVAKDLAENLNISIDSLIGLNLETKEFCIEKVSSLLDSNKLVRFNVLGQIPAGVPQFAEEYVIDQVDILVPSYIDDADLFALKVKGDSMREYIYPGDIVIVKRQNNVDSGDIAVVLVNGFDGTLKRVKKDLKGIYLIPENPKYEIMFFPKEQLETYPIKILGKVIKVERNL